MFIKHIRHWVVVLLCTLSITLSACGRTAEPTPEPTAVPPTATPIPEPTVEPEEAAEPDAEADTDIDAEADADTDADTETDSEVAEEIINSEPVTGTDTITGTDAITDTDIITETVEEAAPLSVVGELTFPSLGNEHIPFGSRSPIEYNTTPPSSGPHYSNIIQWDIYDKPIPYELLVHNLEDGGVTVYYQCEEPCPELVQQLSEAVTPYLEYGWHVVMAPNEPDGEGQFWHSDMGAKIAVVAWQKVLKLDEFDSDTILLFLEAYEGIDHH